jgi:BirA family biotin operon repressor/biotin-[acetyl-CoA-carboxylase] ligase
MNFRRFHYDSTDSTSERAFAALAAGRAQHGDVHVADAQTAGHGRFGRPWYSPAGQGVYLSIVLLPPPPPWHPGAVTVAVALALYDAASELGLSGAWLDWPNDLMAGDAKLGGALVETRGLDPQKPHYVVGLGLNVREREFPRELAAVRPVTSFAMQGVDVEVARVEKRLLDCFSRRCEQIDSTPAELEVDFVHATKLANQPVRVHSGEQVETGVFAGFSFAAGLLLHLPGGREKRLPLEFVRAVERA